MADITAECLLQHRQLLTCRRGTLAITISDKLSRGEDVGCEQNKAQLVDIAMGAICRYNSDATLNCLTNAQVCKLITMCYSLLPKNC